MRFTRSFLKIKMEKNIDEDIERLRQKRKEESERLLKLMEKSKLEDEIKQIRSEEFNLKHKAVLDSTKKTAKAIWTAMTKIGKTLGDDIHKMAQKQSNKPKEDIFKTSKDWSYLKKQGVIK